MQALTHKTGIERNEPDSCLKPGSLRSPYSHQIYTLPFRQAALFIAVFSVPDWSQTAQLVYAFLIFKALGILMSLGSISYTALMPTTPYFAIEVLGKPWMISGMMPAIAGMLLLSSFVSPPFYAKFEIRNGCVAVLGVAALLFMALPLFERSPTIFLSIYITACLATSITITTAFPMIAATVDYHEGRFSTRKEGLLSAGIAFMLGAVSYAPGAAADSAREAIRWSYYGGTVVLLGMQILVLLFWPMDERKAAAV
jgi:Na+/melibiose symporter-like transporter